MPITIEEAKAIVALMNFVDGLSPTEARIRTKLNEWIEANK